MAGLGRGYLYDDWHPTKKYLPKNRDEINLGLEYLGVHIEVDDDLPDDAIVAVTPGGKPMLIKLGDLSLPIDSNKIECYIKCGNIKK